MPMAEWLKLRLAIGQEVRSLPIARLPFGLTLESAFFRRFAQQPPKINWHSAEPASTERLSERGTMALREKPAAAEGSKPGAIRQSIFLPSTSAELIVANEQGNGGPFDAAAGGVDSAPNL